MILKALLGRFIGTFLMLASTWGFVRVEPEAPSEEPATWSVDPSPPLRELAKPHGIAMGTAVRYREWKKDPDYRAMVAQQFDTLVAENVMKMRYIQRKPGQFKFKRADELVAFAEENGMQVRGHTLVWQGGLPDWVKKTEWGPEVLEQVMVDHITTVVGHFRGRVQTWDVVNEAVNTIFPGRRETVWQETLGDGHIALAFRTAHAADPDAKLFYNDFLAEDMGRKSDRVYRLVKGLVEEGVPIHGVGLQAHLHFDQPSRADLIANLRRLAGLGLDIHFTEVDVGIPEHLTPSKRLKQAILYRRLMDACLIVDACTGFVLWGFTDRVSWVPEYFRNTHEPLPFDERLAPKLPFFALADALRDGVPAK